MSKHQSSHKWLARQNRDVYTKLAKEKKYLSRAAFKLWDINKKYNLLNGARNILDLGCSPGSWLQCIKEHGSQRSTVIGVDLKSTAKISGVVTLKGDFTDIDIQSKILSQIHGKFDLICSDMSPQTTGNKSMDHLRSLQLVKSVFNFACEAQQKQGNLILKIFQGERISDFVKELKNRYGKVSYFKPASSYQDSKELFIIAQKLL